MCIYRALSSAGRAFGLHPKCREFDPLSAQSRSLRGTAFLLILALLSRLTGIKTMAIICT